MIYFFDGWKMSTHGRRDRKTGASNTPARARQFKHRLGLLPGVGLELHNPEHDGE
jgi:hypothetical protein